MSLPILFSKTLTPIATALVTLAVCNTPVLADTSTAPYILKAVNYTTAIPVTPQPYLMPYGYNDTARAKSQVVMAGISPSVIDENDTSFEILALVRPGATALQNVTFGQGQNGNPLFNYTLKHINTLKNGDQFWKATYEFQAGAFNGFNKGIVPIRWGTGKDQFTIQTADISSGVTTGGNGVPGNPFPLLSFGNFPSKTAFLDTTKNDILSYNKTKRVVPQILMAGVSPAVVDITDTSFDVVTILRPGLVPVQDVILKQSGNNLFGINLEKKKVLNNGDEVWVANFPFAAGTYGTTTIPVVWGTSNDDYSLQITDVAQQSSTAYPDLRAGVFAAQDKK
ncbi:MAG: hypothetical protein HOP02_13640 [Methylococcaceae bacterium]|nr:hypothetical protein [Methylococcaceae bacterium]